MALQYPCQVPSRWNSATPDSHSMYHALTEDIKLHTKYYFYNNITQTETPTSKRKIVPSTVNPFSLAKKEKEFAPLSYWRNVSISISNVENLHLQLNSGINLP